MMERRQFLKSLALGAFGLGAGKIGIEPPPEDKQTRTTKKGLEVYDHDHWRPLIAVELEDYKPPPINGLSALNAYMTLPPSAESHIPLRIHAIRDRSRPEPRKLTIEEPDPSVQAQSPASKRANEALWAKKEESDGD